MNAGDPGPADAAATAEAKGELVRILEDYQADIETGRTISIDEAIAAHPALADELRASLPVMHLAARMTRAGHRPGKYLAPRLQRLIDEVEPPTDVARSPLTSAEVNVPEPGTACLLGRYRLLERIGQGGMGIVYRAHDHALGRDLAIKVPNPERTTRPEDVQAFLAEARILARLDHSNIVPVHDVGCTKDGLCFVVSKLIQGSDLSVRIRTARPSALESAEMVAKVADALHYAHSQGLVHRDIKPANILIDGSGKPCVADFGLALSDHDFSRADRFAGTPAYMSPEQARGEGHRVDGRSDIFSLGVVFYELLTGRRPFRGESVSEIFEQVTRAEPLTPRQIDVTIPRELERICLKALEKRASERYATASEMAEDLRLYLQAARTTVSENCSLKIVPRGLRSFDEQDSDFFLELLPGPRDRDGLPDSIRFWKTRIETTDPEKTFQVGVIYGPSGCGKSSLVKAGLLPRLAEHVRLVSIEATFEDTENRLLKGLRRALPDLSPQANLIDSLTAVRTGRVLHSGRKVLVVLDQFEQWLHARMGKPNPELVGALRQCDGEHAQVLIIVRDDFWLAVSRFMDELEIPLVQGQNSALVDLFDCRHAGKVLTTFGIASGTIPERTGDISKDQHAFLDQAVTELAQDGKVISVRLALFAEMMKGKPWTAASLRAVGGTGGVCINFLEATFSSSEAHPKHRTHEKAAQAALKVLMPETGLEIKGQMRSERELQEAVGYADRHREFAELIHILDNELRLITPTEPLDMGDRQPTTLPGRRYYQLTHDYLVQPLRDWLTSKQRETHRGRAEIRLAECSALWNARPRNRRLPSFVEWASIRLLTRKGNWNESQRRMMNRAGRVHAARGVLAFAILTVGVLAGLSVRHRVNENQQATLAAGLVQGLLDADTPHIPEIVGAMRDYHRWIDSPLRRELGKPSSGPRRKLHASLALLPVDASQVDFLFDHLIRATPSELPVLRDALSPYQATLRTKLWTVLDSAKLGDASLLPAAAALAIYAPDDGHWEAAGGKVARSLVSVNPVFLGSWLDSLRPVRSSLTSPLAAIFRDKSRPETEHTLATDILTDYARDDPDLIADLLLDADPKAYGPFFAIAQQQQSKTLGLLQAEIARKPTIPQFDKDSEAVKDRLAGRQARAAIALLRMRRAGEILPLLSHSADPRLRSFIVNWLRPLGADPRILAAELDRLPATAQPTPAQGQQLMDAILFHPETSMRRALILALGTYGGDGLSKCEWKPPTDKLLDLYRNDPDSGIHGAAEWTLRKWGQPEKLKELDAELSKLEDQGQRRWFVNSQGQTFAVIEGPVEFHMGSPPSEPKRESDEILHLCSIPRRFALATKEVTVEQYQVFAYENLAADKAINDRYSPDLKGPMNLVNWYHAAAYCNWLSRKENLPECYEPNERGKYAEGMKIHVDALQRTGYRLPTEAEWEYGCRARAETSRSYGASLDLLGRYAWHIATSQDRAWPCGSLQPNDLGLFDMLGNLFEWCQDRYLPYRTSVSIMTRNTINFADVLDEKDHRLVRGGSFPDRPAYIRSAARLWKETSGRVTNVGFRLCRTYP